MKSHLNLSVDADLIKKAREQGMEISGLTEWAIREKLGEKTINIKEPEKCHVCGKVEPKAIAAEPDKGLTWLFPDEIWICPSCLKRKMSRVPISQ